MKIIEKTGFILRGVLCIIGLLGVASCKDNTPTPDSVVPKGKFMFHLHTYIDNSEVDLYDIVYTTLEGRKMSLSMAQLYVSDIQLVKLDGTTVPISGKKILKVFETDTDLVGDVPVGNYKSMTFKVGLDPNDKCA